jgi:hypothetical protein
MTGHPLTPTLSPFQAGRLHVVGRTFLPRHLGADLLGSRLQDDVDGRDKPGHDGQKPMCERPGPIACDRARFPSPSPRSGPAGSRLQDDVDGRDEPGHDGQETHLRLSW